MSILAVRQAIAGCVDSWSRACAKVADDGVVEVSRARVESLKRALADVVESPYFLEDEAEEGERLRWRSARR